MTRARCPQSEPRVGNQQMPDEAFLRCLPLRQPYLAFNISTTPVCHTTAAVNCTLSRWQKMACPLAFRTSETRFSDLRV